MEYWSKCIAFVGMKEYWKEIPNFEGHYSISNYGRVESFKPGKARIMRVDSYFEASKKGFKEVIIIPLLLKDLFPKKDIMYLKTEEHFDLEGEEWRDVVGWEDLYSISNFGRLKTKEKYLNSPNCKRGIRFIPEKMIRARVYNSGHLRATLHRENKCVTKLVHRLVAEAFLPRIEGKNWVNHKDCNKLNNQVDNLEWCTPSENVQHAWANGRMPIIRGEDKINAKLTEEQVIEVRRVYALGGISQDKLALLYSVKRGCIKSIVENKSWKYLLENNG